jgi:hypothetical protein
MKTNTHFWSYLAQFFLEREMFQTKVVEKIKTHILCSITFFFETRAVYEIMWENIVERGRPQLTIWRMHIACWIPKDTDTHSEYVNTYCFSTATMVMRTRVNFTEHVHYCLVGTKKIGYSTDIWFLTYGLTVLAEMTSPQYDNIRTANWITGSLCFMTAVGNHAALRIERAASMPVWQVRSTRSISQHYLLHASGLEYAVCCALRIVLCANSYCFTKQHFTGWSL